MKVVRYKSVGAALACPREMPLAMAMAFPPARLPPSPHLVPPARLAHNDQPPADRACPLTRDRQHRTVDRVAQSSAAPQSPSAHCAPWVYVSPPNMARAAAAAAAMLLQVVSGAVWTINGGECGSCTRWAQLYRRGFVAVA